MVQYRRNFVPGGTYFFTVTLADRTSSALVHHVDSLRRAFRIARRERPFTINAIVILPDHLHTIWTLTSGDSDFSGRWKRIKAHFTHRLVAAGAPVKRHRNGDFALWQRRFWEHTIRNECDFERHVDYIHFNPVKHKLVNRVSEWPYSSFHAYGSLDARLGGRCWRADDGCRRAAGVIRIVAAWSEADCGGTAPGRVCPGFRSAPSGLLAAATCRPCGSS